MSDENPIDRRSFVTGALGAAAGIGAASLLGETAQAQPPGPGGPGGRGGPPGGPGGAGAAGGPGFGGRGGRGGAAPSGSTLYRLEADVRDCQITGSIPSDLNGAFYRVGPDPQYPL